MSVDCVDRASAAVTTVMNSLRDVYAPDADCPPLGGSTTKVSFFAGDAALIDEVDCSSPLLWVRLSSRHRSEVFPEPTVERSPCGSLDVIVVEVGVARCADMDPNAATRATEAEISLDDTWRLAKAMCLASIRLGSDHHVGTDSISPYGPEGGIIAWTSTMFISV